MSAPLFFQRFREAVARLPIGLVRTGAAADARAISAAEATLGAPLPRPFVSFLESFDGVDLFHEGVVVGGVGSAAPRRLADMNAAPSARGELVFAESTSGDRFAFRADGAVLRLPGDAEGERWLAGTDFPRWLDARIAHDRVLYAADGEFSPDVFDDDGSEVVPIVALRQTERALRADPGSADFHHERGVALRRLDRVDEAEEAFAQAAALDTANPWPWFDLGRTALGRGVPGARSALDAFVKAAGLDSGASAARLWIWAARAAIVAGLPERLEACRREALALAPGLAGDLQRAQAAAVEEDDPEAAADAEAMLTALTGPTPTARARLTVLAPTPPAAPPPRPSRPEPRSKGKRSPAPPARRASAKKKPKR